MSAHTPGPWVVGREVTSRGSLVYIQIVPLKGDVSPISSVSVYQYDAKGQAVGERDRFGDVKPTVLSAEVQANARLIAAAPDLLEAAETLLLEVVAGSDPEVRVAVLLAARAAIVKARGK